MFQRFNIVRVVSAPLILFLLKAIHSTSGGRTEPYPLRALEAQAKSASEETPPTTHAQYVKTEQSPSHEDHYKMFPQVHTTTLEKDDEFGYLQWISVDDVQEEIGSLQPELLIPPLVDGYDNSYQARQLSAASECWENNVGISGVELSYLEGIPNADSCHFMCSTLQECAYFSFVVSTSRCIFYSSAYNTKASADVISGSKVCLSTVKQKRAESTAPSLESIGPSLKQMYQKTPIPISDVLSNVPKQTQRSYVEPEAVVVTTTTTTRAVPAAQGGILSTLFAAPFGLGNNLFGNRVFGGTTVRNGTTQTSLFPGAKAISSILPSFTNISGPLNGVTQALGLGTPTNNGIRSTLTNGVKVSESVVSAGNTFLEAVPVMSIIQSATNLLQQTAPLLNQGVTGGVPLGASSKSDASMPPTGVGQPQVACFGDGMRCCVPRQAVPRYQSNPPRLNGSTKDQCRATYTSSTDELCVTTLYTDTTCGTMISETSTVFVYRNMMEIPLKTMNNAICECMISKPALNPNAALDQIDKKPPTISGTGKWEYSLAAKKEEEASIRQAAASTELFVNSTKLVSNLLKEYANTANGPKVNTNGKTPLISLIDNIGDITSGVQSLIEMSPLRFLSSDE